ERTATYALVDALGVRRAVVAAVGRDHALRALGRRQRARRGSARSRCRELELCRVRRAAGAGARRGLTLARLVADLTRAAAGTARRIALLATLKYAVAAHGDRRRRRARSRRRGRGRGRRRALTGLRLAHEHDRVGVRARRRSLRLGHDLRDACPFGRSVL